MGEIFDIAEARGVLVRRRESLVAECKACHEVCGCLWVVGGPLFSSFRMWVTSFFFQAISAVSQTDPRSERIQGVCGILDDVDSPLLG